MAQQVEPWQWTPASHIWSTSWCPGCSASYPVSCRCTWEGTRRIPITCEISQVGWLLASFWPNPVVSVRQVNKSQCTFEINHLRHTYNGISQLHSDHNFIGNIQSRSQMNTGLLSPIKPDLGHISVQSELVLVGLEHLHGYNCIFIFSLGGGTSDQGTS